MKTLLLPVALLAPMATLPPATGEGAEDVAARLADALGAALELEPRLRPAAVGLAVHSTHELGGMAARLAGEEAWTAASEAERSQLASAVGDLAAAIYTSDLVAAAGPPVQVGPPALDGRRASVTWELPAARGDAARLTLELRLVDQGWRAVDLAAEGALGFEELRSVFAAGEGRSVAALTEALRARAARLVEPPAAVVARLQDALIEAMKRADELGYGGRRALLEPVVATTHDFESIVKLVLGRAWRELSDEDFARLVATFGELALASYAARFDGYDGQRFGPPEARPVRPGAAKVHSAFRKAGGGQVDFEYLMRHGDGRWRILNIVVDGVSDLALKKTEYGALIERGGAEAVLAKLTAEIARHAAGQKD